jgi:hypothetical protein
LGNASNNASITGQGFTTSSGFTFFASGTGVKTITSSANVLIDNNTAATALDTVHFVTNGNSVFTVNAAYQTIGSLTVTSGKTALGATLHVKTDISIVSGTVLDTSSSDIILDRHWIQDFGAQFVARSQTVYITAAASSIMENGRPVVYIYGLTRWYNFVCDTSYAVSIKFARNSNAITSVVEHAFDHQFLVRTSDVTQRTLLTKMENADYAAIGKSAFAPADGNGAPEGLLPLEHRDYFWNIVVLVDNVILNNVTINYSWAEPDSILVLGPEFAGVDATPYTPDFTDPDPYAHFAHYCVGWTKGVHFIYSFTEDSNNNGRIDRIRVQASISMNYDFSDFLIEVDGYTVTGYEPIPSGLNPNRNMFWILLEEKPYADGGVLPLWNLRHNTSLKDIPTMTEEFEALHPDMLPINTTWPIVHYSLMLPKNPGDTYAQQLFIQFSEPVIAPIISTDLYGASPNPVALAPIVINNNTYASEYTIDFASNQEFDISQLTAESKYQIINNAQVKDYRVGPDPKIVQLGYPFPMYPQNQNYALYSFTTDNNPVAAALLTNPISSDYKFRVTDVLISIPPANQDDHRYFAWPILGIDELGLHQAFELSKEYDLVSIRKFDGTGDLRDSNITIETLVNEKFSSNPDLIMGVNVPIIDRGSRPYTSDQLWLPYDSGLVPRKFESYPPYPTNSILSNNRVNHVIGKEEDDYKDDDIVDFYFSVSGVTNLVAGRLDIAAGSAIPADWYRCIKPFSFNIRELILQRGGATILNNVINPTKGQKTYLNYTLTKSGQVTVQVFTLDGNMVQVLYRGRRPPGDYVDSWDGKNRGGRAVARGMYFIRIVGPDIDEIRKVMVVK